MAKQSDEKEKFRPDMSALDREIESALGGMSIDDLYTQSNKQAGESRAKGPRKGKVVAVDKDDVMVDFGGKSQGVAPMEQFETEPKVGDEMEFEVERYDAREGLLILNRKGAAATNV